VLWRGADPLTWDPRVVMKFVRKVIVGGTAPNSFLQGLQAALPKTAEDEGLAGGGQSAPEHRTGGQEIMAEEPAATEEAAANSPEYGVGADSPEYGVGAGGAARGGDPGYAGGLHHVECAAGQGQSGQQCARTTPINSRRCSRSSRRASACCRRSRNREEYLSEPYV
jgi:hypothetical protein